MQTNPRKFIENDVNVEWHSTTYEKYPFLKSMPGLSVTEYEIQYAALIDKPACSRVFFYFRDEKHALRHAILEEERILYQAENPEAARRQVLLKKKIGSKFGTVTYKGAENFCDQVTSHLSYSINKDFSEGQVRNAEDQAHHQFMQHRLAGFEGRGELLKKILSQVDEQLESEEEQITVLAAESGIGKSSLMAATAQELNKQKSSDKIVFTHFVGCTNLSNYVESISIRFWNCVIESNPLLKEKIKDKIKDEIKEKCDMFYQKEGIQGLFRSLEGVHSNKKYVFLVDAINQLHPSQDTPVPHSLTWLPKKAPKNVALVVSTIDTHESCKTMRELSDFDPIRVTKLNNEEIEGAVNSFLKRYDKKVSRDQMNLIKKKEADTGHPLYLRLVLEEIRIFGVYEKLTQEIQTLLGTEGVIELYNLIISRWEKKFNKENAKIVEIAMKVLFVSRIGLSDGDLDQYMKDKVGVKFNLAEWKSFFFTLIESLFVRNGRYMYFHQLLLETVKTSFFGEEGLLKAAQKEYGMWLHGQYGESADCQEDLVAEICHNLVSGDCYYELVEYLRNEYVVESMLRGRYRYEFFKCWRQIHEIGAGNYKDTYKSLVQSTSKAGQLLVDFFLEDAQNAFLKVCIEFRLKRKKEDEKADDYLALGRVYKNMQK
eukprot:TRINITY_DN6116_c0_g4_i1.p1 TRINITY_DN6116_c0_g4~~TRINITY_DN6116_c0_g4_i1.p1  ORF type:complete len:743 (-),score=142.75 TRINITY_DN6116_c0_g4_i1:1566-3533(-)